MQPIDFSSAFADRVKIQKRLRWVLVRAVPGVDHACFQPARQKLRSASGAVAQHENIVGIKDSSGDMVNLVEMIRLAGVRDDFTVMTGHAGVFYAALCACEVEEIAIGARGVYRVLRRGEERIAGIMKHPEDVHPHWLPYVKVRDVDAATRRAVEHGAKIYVPAVDVPGFWRFSGIDDPTGAGVCLHAR